MEEGAPRIVLKTLRSILSIQSMQVLPKGGCSWWGGGGMGVGWMGWGALLVRVWVVRRSHMTASPQYSGVPPKRPHMCMSRGTSQGTQQLGPGDRGRRGCS